MHVTKGGWVGQTFALAANDDSRGRKSRIRRSKEERKEMVESFIKKYQKSNSGNFPSLNLTHREVGGSFYTVRELVREIIQENRVLGPAKSFLKEHNNSEFLKQYPLGSISIQPQTDFVSGKTEAVIDISPDDRVTNENHISISNGTFRGPESFVLDNDVNGHSQAVQENKGLDELGTKHDALIPQDTSVEEVSKASGQFSQPESQEFENEQTVNSCVVPGNYRGCDRQIISQFSGEVTEPGTTRLSDERIVNVDRVLERRTNKFEERVDMESVVRENPDGEKDGAKELKASEAAISPVNADVIVEKFPSRPFSTIHGADGGSIKSRDVTGALGNGATQLNRTSFDSFSGSINEEVDENFPGSTLEGNESRDEKPLKHEGPSLGSSNCCGTDEATALDVNGIRDVEVKHSLPDGITASDSPEQLISPESTAFREKPNISDNDNFLEENNRNSQETSEGTSKKTSAPEANALWALLIAFLLAIVKFWTK